MTEPAVILVIDDSEDDRLLYRRALQKIPGANYSVSEVDDGEAGLRHIEGDPPACVLLDYSLPGRNGVEVLKRIRSRYLFVPVVMLTGQGNETVAVTAMQEGAQNYISKSTITPESLQRVIRIAIEHCALHRRIHEQRTSLEIFTRALAHDLKEPVRTIRSFLDLIAAHEQLSERGKGYFNYIQNAADRMTTLIDTVYLYTRLEGSEQIAMETCDLALAMADVKENLSELIRERHAMVTCDTLPQVFANRMQMIQVLQNLLANAIRHCEMTPLVHVRAEAAGHHWMFRVSDNGPGVSQQHRDKIFEPFKRMARHKEQGLGLGLAICRKIVESHGGKIWYESNVDAGATFIFTLPIALPTAADISGIAPGAPAPGKARVEAKDGRLGTILLVEDNEADVELTRIMLIEEAHLKCNLLVAHDGHEALDLLHDAAAAAKPIDLILLDINMPGMDGFEFLGRLRADEALRHMPVVICTTSTYDKDMEKAKELGVAGYLTKPADLGRLKAIVDKAPTVQLFQEGDGYTLCAA